MMKRLTIPLLSVLLLASGCATNPVTQEEEFVLMSEQQELELGRQMAAEVARQMPLLPAEDPLTRFVDRVGQRVAATADRPELFYHFHVVDDGGINAFALPGGYIYVHRGLLAHLNSEAELAAVLAHEVGHVTARHAVQRYTQVQSYQLGMAVASIFAPMPQGTSNITDLLALAVIQGYGREAEFQADQLSLEYIRRAGYDVRATVEILETIERLDAIEARERRDAGEEVRQYHGAFASHPETRRRIDEAIAQAAAMQEEAEVRVGHGPMVKALAGYPYGDSPDQGAVVGRRFVHPDLGIQLEFPRGWVIRNTPAALTARLRGEEVYFQLSLRELRRRRTAAEVLESLFPRRRVVSLHTGSQEGFRFARGIVHASAPNIRRAAIDATVYLDGPRAYILATWCEQGRYGEFAPDFRNIAASFGRYDARRDGDVPRIRLHTWKAGESWEALAARGDNILGRFTADRLAALNGMDPGKTPTPGTLVKTVE